MSQSGDMLVDSSWRGEPLTLKCQKCGKDRIFWGPRSVSQLVSDAIEHECEIPGQLALDI